MHKINLKLTNGKKVTVATLLITFFGLTTILFPLALIYTIPQSGIGYYFSYYINYVFITVPILIYFAVTGVYFYKIKIDPYIINITSFRTISGFFQKVDFVDISHAMLRDYSFFDRTFSFNKTLMLKIETTSGKKIAKRFNLTLISRGEIKRISNILDRIIVNNN
jgi:hypothetical protein